MSSTKKTLPIGREAALRSIGNEFKSNVILSANQVNTSLSKGGIALACHHEKQNQTFFLTTKMVWVSEMLVSWPDPSLKVF